MKLKLIKTFVFTCSRCNAWQGRIPQWYGDCGDKSDSCHKCGCTSFNIREGRPYGNRSSKWEKLLVEFEEVSDTWMPIESEWLLSTLVLE